MPKSLQKARGVTGPYFCWEVPAEQLVVVLHLNLVQQMAAKTAAAGAASAAGVLLGRVETDRQSKLIVEGYEDATPEHGAAESPFKDHRLVMSILDRWRSRAGRMSVIGFCRACGREGAALNRDDLWTLARSSETGEKSKTDADRVFVVIEPCGARGSKASFYLSRNGAVVCQSPRIPFTRADLSRIGCVRQAPGAGIQDLNYTPARARREEAAQFPEFPMPSDRESGKATRRGWLAAGAVLIALVGLSILRMSGNQVLNIPSARAEGQNERQLGLQIQRKGNDWEIAWDQNSSAVRQAKVAHLRINDDLIHKDIELGPSELRSGKILYSPSSDDVVVVMEAESSDPANNINESVRLVTGLLPTPEFAKLRGAERSVVVRTKPTPPGNHAAAPDSPIKRQNDSNYYLLTAPQRSAETFGGRSSASAKMPASPPLWTAGENGKPAALLSNTVTLPAVPPAKPPDSLAWPELPSDQRRPGFRRGAVPAELMVRINPMYPEEAKDKKIEGEVEVQFRISREGEVKDPIATRGNLLLADAAVRAVRGWRYKPALLDGSPTESHGKVAVSFRLD